jgi:O-antigen ligase
MENSVGKDRYQSLRTPNSILILSVAAFFISIAMTPWMNTDSLVIPKLSILFLTALYLFPNMLIKIRGNFIHPNRPVLILSCLYLVQIIFVVVSSPAPIEQQVFGRTGRGLGLITEISLLILMVVTFLFIKENSISTIANFLLLASLVSAIYAIIQFYGLDFFEWTTRTNGIIGTLGNPNFQSSFAVMGICILLASKPFLTRKKLICASAFCLLLFTLFIADSYQGYIILVVSLVLFLTLFFWFKNRLLSLAIILFSLPLAIVVFLGMLNIGPMASFLYKISVKSRGEFFRTSLNIANDHPFLGVGLDSLGDNYLMYRSKLDAMGVGEFTDNAHNIFLNYASTGGYTLALLYLSIMILALFNFFKRFQSQGQFNFKLVAVFVTWFAYQLQSAISPNNISMMVWNSILTGVLLASGKTELVNKMVSNENKNQLMDITRPFANFLLLIGLVIIYPYINVDRVQLQAQRTSNGELALQTVSKYPESVLRYSRVGEEFLKSNLFPQALEIGRAAINFNPNAVSAWGLVFVNPLTPPDEKIRAQQEILRLDPFNKDLSNLVNNPSKLAN